MNKGVFWKLLALLQIVALFVMGSFAWFAESSTPSIEENEIRVTSAEGLYIKLDPDSEARTTINLNQIVSHFGDFELKQVSSANAIDFYTIDFGQGLSQGNPEFVSVNYTDGGASSSEMLENGFIYYDFYLQTEEFGKHVYLHKDTFFTGPAEDAIRVAITFEDENENEQIYIFGNNRENGITHPFTTEAVIDEGSFVFNNIDPSLIGNQIVYTFDQYDGGRGVSDSDPLDNDKILFSIPSNQLARVNVKIWLEGGDEACDNSISSTLLDLRLKFGSANILLEAPELTANTSDNTITGLDTTMEYSFDEEPGATWNDVTDPEMTFSNGQTVYVRIKEVFGESPSSEIVTLQF